MRRTLMIVAMSAVAAGAVVSATALAGSSAPLKTQGQARAERQKTQFARQDRVAQHLGKSGQDLRAARAKALSAALDRLVSSGALTSAERSAILACRSAPLTCDRTNLPVKPRKLFKTQRKQMATDTARALGVDLKQLRSAMKAEKPAKAHKK